MKLSIAEVLQTGFKVATRRFGTFFFIALIFNVPLTVLMGLIASKTNGHSGENVVNMIASTTIQGAVVSGVLADLRGRDVTIRGCVGEASTRFGALLVTTFLTNLGIVLGLLLLVVPGVILALQWSVAAPIVLIERLSPAAALRRSRELVRGSYGEIFVIYLVAVLALVLPLCMLVVAQLLLTGQSFADFGKVEPPLSLGLVGYWVVEAAATSTSVVFIATITGVLYARLRYLREGADVDQIASVFA
jgi:Membrane domain of glycerophosphoryl diester phosphodiesterase